MSHLIWFSMKAHECYFFKKKGRDVVHLNQNRSTIRVHTNANFF